MKKILLGCVVIFSCELLYAQKNTSSGVSSGVTTGKERVIYQYKKDEYFDFDALSVKGELLSPGDLSTKTNRRVKFQLKKYIRKDFDDFIADDLLEVY